MTVRRQRSDRSECAQIAASNVRNAHPNARSFISSAPGPNALRTQSNCSFSMVSGLVIKFECFTSDLAFSDSGSQNCGVQDLRHCYASGALALDESLTMIGRLLGHTQVQTTTRYAQLARDPIQKVAARITGSIAGSLAPSGQRAAHDVQE